MGIIQVIETITLYNTSPGHNKFYTISVVQDADGTYSVPFTYGPIDGWRKTKHKTSGVGRLEAYSAYERVRSAKHTGGYKPGADMCVPTSSGIPIPTSTGTHNPNGSLIGSNKPTRPIPNTVSGSNNISKPKPSKPHVPGLTKSCQLLTEVDQDRALELVQDDAYCGQEKHDGKRMKLQYDDLASNIKLVAVNKKGLVCGCEPLYESSLNCVHDVHMTIDGESVGQNYYAFDMFGLDGKDLRGMTYRDRLAQLEFTMPSDLQYVHVVETSYTTLEKAALMQALIQGNKEGIVFKKLDAVHTDGRGGEQFKHKFYATASCLVIKQNAKRSVALGILDGSALVGIGNCTIPPNKTVPAVGEVVEIRYLYAYKGGSLYQPIYLGARDDTDRDECVIAQLKYKAAA